MGSQSTPVFGNGLEFGGFGGDDGFGNAEERAASDSRNRHIIPASGEDGFGLDDDDPFNIGGDDVSEQPVNFGDTNLQGDESTTSFESNISGGTSRSGNTRSSRSDRSSENNKPHEAWKLRESWKNSARSHSSSSSNNPSRPRNRRLPPRSKSHQGQELFDDQVLSPSVQASRSRRLPARSRSHQGEQLFDNDTLSPSVSLSSADTPTQSRKSQRSPTRSRGDRSPSRISSPARQEGEKQRALPGRTRSGMRSRRGSLVNSAATADGASVEDEPEARTQRSRRRASLVYGSVSDGQMEPVERAPAIPRRNVSVDGGVGLADDKYGYGDGEPSSSAPSTNARQRTRRRASISSGLEAPGGFDPMQMNLPPQETKAPQKDFMRDRSKNQQKILDMAKLDKKSDQVPSSTHISIETIPDALDMGSNHETSKGLGLGKMIRKATGTGKGKDKQIASDEIATLAPDINRESGRRQRRGSITGFVHKGKSKKDKSTDEDYTERRDIEGRNKASFLERVAGGGSGQDADGGVEGKGGTTMSYSERIMMAQQRSKR
jgi:hypothetical protein